MGFNRKLDRSVRSIRYSLAEGQHARTAFAAAFTLAPRHGCRSIDRMNSRARAHSQRSVESDSKALRNIIYNRNQP